jgi:hypothetical protein
MRRTRLRLLLGLLAVEVIAGGLTPALVERRRRSFLSLAKFHQSKRVSAIACSAVSCTAIGEDGKEMTADEIRASGWHAHLEAKYRAAAESPWLPVSPDPLPPQ